MASTTERRRSNSSPVTIRLLDSEVSAIEALAEKEGKSRNRLIVEYLETLIYDPQK